VRTAMRNTYALVTILVAGCSAVGTNENSVPEQGGPTSVAGAKGSLGGSGGKGGAAAGGRPGFGMAGLGSGGAPNAVAGSASGGSLNFAGAGVGGRFGGGGSPFGAGGKGGGMGGTASGGTGAGGRGGGGSGSGAGGRAGGGSAGGTGAAGAPTSTCTEASKTVSNNGTGKHCNYTYEYWKDSGNGTLTLKSDGFSIDWSGVNDLLGRKGIRPGSGNLVVNYDANYQPSGNSYLCIYGWTRNPLVEYYIVDSWGTWRPPGGQGHVGTVTSDGGTYDIYKISKTGPSIDGNGAFTQYWSVRTAKKTSGIITIANHFAAWKTNGMPMGSFYEVSMTVEGYQSSGKADVKFTMQ